MPEEAEIVRKIFELYMQGNGVRKIKKYLEDFRRGPLAGRGVSSLLNKNRCAGFSLGGDGGYADWKLLLLQQRMSLNAFVTALTSEQTVSFMQIWHFQLAAPVALQLQSLQLSREYATINMIKSAQVEAVLHGSF